MNNQSIRFPSLTFEDDVVMALGNISPLSNYVPLPITVIFDSHYLRAPTATHAFAACQLIHFGRAEMLPGLFYIENPKRVELASSPFVGAARPYGRLITWLTQGALVAMTLIVNAKFDQHPGLDPILEATGTKSIVVCGEDDRYWCAGVSLADCAQKVVSAAPGSGQINRYRIGGRNLLGSVLECRRQHQRERRHDAPQN